MISTVCYQNIVIMIKCNPSWASKLACSYTLHANGSTLLQAILAEDFQAMIFVFRHNDVTVPSNCNAHGVMQVMKSSDEAKETPIKSEFLNSVVCFVSGVDIFLNVKCHSTQLRSFVILAVDRQNWAKKFT